MIGLIEQNEAKNQSHPTLGRIHSEFLLQVCIDRGRTTDTQINMLGYLVNASKYESAARFSVLSTVS